MGHHLYVWPILRVSVERLEQCRAPQSTEKLVYLVFVITFRVYALMSAEASLGRIEPLREKTSRAFTNSWIFFAFLVPFEFIGRRLWRQYLFCNINF